MKKLLVILVTMLPLVANADPVEIDGIWYNLVNKVKKAEVTYKKNSYYSGNLEIPDKVTYQGVDYSVTAIGNMAFYYQINLKSVKIPKSVTSIENNSFVGCSGLYYITIPNSVNNIGDYAFGGCSGLASISVEDGNTIYDSRNNCNALIETKSNRIIIGCNNSKIPNSVEIIGHSAFYNCKGLTSVTIPEGVTVIEESAFEGCSSLTFASIPNSVKRIGEKAFYGCSCLSKISIGNGVTKIEDNAFAQCTDITEVNCMVESLSSNSWEENLYTYTSAFEGSYIEYATLRVPECAIDTYKNTLPWSGFGVYESLKGDDANTPKCSSPTISFENGEIVFNCEMEGVEYVSEIISPDVKKYDNERVKLSYRYKVSVYATKEGYKNSDTVTAEFTSIGKLGDLTGDGKVDVADHVKLSDIIMKQK